MKKLFVFSTVAGMSLSCQRNKNISDNQSYIKLLNLTQYVNPFIGTGDHGH